MKETLEEFSVQFLNVIYRRVVAQNSINIVLVLQGEIILTPEGETAQTLRENQLQVINRNQEWWLEGASDNIVVTIMISPLWLFGRGEDLTAHHFHVQNDRHSQPLTRIVDLIRQIATRWLKQNSDTWRLETHKDLLEIFCILLERCKSSAPVHHPKNLSPRIARTVTWVQEHYPENLSLQEIASRLHVSSAHLSRQFRAEVGSSFREFLTETRFKRAVRDIALTSRPIGQLVSDNGFCSLRRFSLLFRQRYALQPSVWRKGVRAGTLTADTGHIAPPDEQRTRRISPVALFSLLSRRVDGSGLTPGSDIAFRAESVNPTFAQPKGRIIPRRYTIAVNRADELLKQHVQEQLHCLKAQLPSFQVEMADPLNDFLSRHNIHTGELNPTWSPWSNLDLACGFLKKLGVNPLFRLSTTAKNDMLEEFIHHNLLLLGREYVQSWSFIIEPGEESVENASLLIQQQLELIRRLLPECQTGIVWQQRGELSLPTILLKQFDFIGFSVTTNQHIEQSRSPEFRPLDTQQVIHQQLDAVIQHLKKHAIDCPLYLQSWSTLTGNTLMINGLFFRGALLMEMLLSLPAEVSMLGLWLNSELQNEICSSNIIDNNSVSLFFNGTTKRPIFHIIAIRERLQETLFDSGSGWVATRNDTAYQVVLFNAVTINPQLSVEQHLLNDYSKCFQVHIPLAAAGIWRIKQWVFDQKNGALYHQYGLHPTRYDRDEETMRYISQRSEPTLSVRDERLTGHWATDIVMDINAVCLLELTWIAA